MEASTVNQYLEVVGDWFVTSGLRILLIVVLMMFALKFSQVIAGRMLNLFTRRQDDVEMQKRADTLSSVIRYALNIVIFVVATLMVMDQLGIEIGPILAAAGVIGLAVGFGAQTLVQDVISGFFILLEDQIRVGDVVDIGGKAGLVEQVNLRMVILRDLGGNVHYVRNSEINIVTNMTKGYSRYVFNIGVAYKEDIDKVIEVIKAVDEDLRADEKFKSDILEPIEILGLDQFSDSALIIKARIKTMPIKQWSTARAFNRRLKIAFDKNNIEIPFPHRTIYFGEDNQGHPTATMNVNVAEKKTDSR